MVTDLNVTDDRRVSNAGLLLNVLTVGSRWELNIYRPRAVLDLGPLRKTPLVLQLCAHQHHDARQRVLASSLRPLTRHRAKPREDPTGNSRRGSGTRLHPKPQKLRKPVTMALLSPP